MRQKWHGDASEQSEKGGEPIGTPRSTVRILQGPAELAEAIARAVAFEKARTDRYRARLDRYDDELRASHPVLMNLPPANEGDEGEHDGGDRLPA